MFKHFKDVTKPARKITKFYSTLDEYAEAFTEIANKSNTTFDYVRKPEENKTGVIVWIEK